MNRSSNLKYFVDFSTSTAERFSVFPFSVPFYVQVHTESSFCWCSIDLNRNLKSLVCNLCCDRKYPANLKPNWTTSTGDRKLRSCVALEEILTLWRHWRLHGATSYAVSIRQDELIYWLGLLNPFTISSTDHFNRSSIHYLPCRTSCSKALFISLMSYRL